jgi:hypothetical protein
MDATIEPIAQADPGEVVALPDDVHPAFNAVVRQIPPRQIGGSLAHTPLHFYDEPIPKTA